MLSTDAVVIALRHRTLVQRLRSSVPISMSIAVVMLPATSSCSAVCPCSLHFLASAFTAPVLFWPGTCPSPHCCGDLPFLSMVVSCHAFTAALLYCLFKRRIGTWFVFHAGPTALLGALTLLSRIGDVSLGPIALALAASVTRCWRSFIFISRRFCTWFYVVDLENQPGTCCAGIILFLHLAPCSHARQDR